MAAFFNFFSGTSSVASERSSSQTTERRKFRKRRSRKIEDIPQIEITWCTVHGDLILKASIAATDHLELPIHTNPKLDENEWVESFKTCIPKILDNIPSEAAENYFQNLVTDDLVAGRENQPVQAEDGLENHIKQPGTDKEKHHAPNSGIALASNHLTATANGTKQTQQRNLPNKDQNNAFSPKPLRTQSDLSDFDFHDADSFKARTPSPSGKVTSDKQNLVRDASEHEPSIHGTQSTSQVEADKAETIERQEHQGQELKIRITELESEINLLGKRIQKKNELATMMAQTVLRLSSDLRHETERATIAETTLEQESQNLADMTLQRNNEHQTSIAWSKEAHHFQGKWKAANVDLIALREHTSFVIADATIQQEYKGIVHEVRNWTDNYCTSKTYLNSQDSREWEEFRHLSPRAETYWSNRRLRPLLIQAFIMKRIVRNILSFDETKGLNWAVEVDQWLRPLHAEIEARTVMKPHGTPEEERARLDLLQDYSLWKSRTALLLGKTQPSRRREPGDTSASSGLATILKSFLNPKSSAWTDLEEIFQHAIDLDEKLHMSRAIFHFDTEFYEPEFFREIYEFDEVHMETMVGYPPGQNGTAVDLVVVPGLLKTGNGNGEGFEIMSRLVRSQVMCLADKQQRNWLGRAK